MNTYIAPAQRAIAPPTMAAKAISWAPFALISVLVLVALLFPEYAFAQDAKQKVGAAAKKAFDIVFEIVYWMCAIAVVVAGLGATFGRMEWGKFGQIVAGIVVVFASTLIVDYFK